MSEAKKIVKKFSIFALGPVINILIGFFSVPITTRLLLPEEFGKSAMYSTVYWILVFIFQLGLGHSCTIEYGLTDDKKKLVFHSLLPAVLFFSLASVPILLLRDNISLLLFNDKHPGIILLLLINVLIEIFLSQSGSIIRLQEKAFVSTLSTVLNRLLSFLFTVGFLLWYKRDFSAIILGQMFAHLIVLIIQIINTRDHFGFTDLDQSLMRNLFIIGLPVLPAQLIGWFSNSVDKIALRTWTDLAELGIYGAANKFVILVTIFSSAFNNLWMPVALRWWREGKNIKVFKQTNIILGLAMSYLIIGIILVKDILIYYFGSEYYEAKYVMPFLLLLPAFQVFSYILSIPIHANKKSYLTLILSSITLIINIIGNTLLVPRFGALGAAMSTAFSALIMWVVNIRISSRLWHNIISFRFVTIPIGLCSVPISSLFQGYFYIPWGIFVIFIITIINRKDFLYLVELLLDMFRNFQKRRKKSNI